MMSDNQKEPQRGGSEVDSKVGDSQMDGKGGYDQADAAGYPPEDPSYQGRQQPAFKDLKIQVITDIADIREEEFNSQTYKTCKNVGKAVIVSNFMDGYVKRNNRDLAIRSYATGDCQKLEGALKRIGFQPLDNQDSMVHKNLTKSQFIALYNKVAKEINYRPKGQEGYTSVLFFVMSYGRSGLIRCHAEPGDKGDHPFVEQKHLQEAFQPQNNHSLALKPKLFIIQTIPESTSEADAAGATEVTTTKRIPREADFLTYACDHYCIKGENNVFIDSVVHVLNNLAKEKEESKPAMEIQKVLIRMNKQYKDTRKYQSWKLPCVTSSLTKQLILF
ncbi:uncharacterized protein LOC134728188 [Mytilus trossulus]|uniref:uncharacterized protein LOC134728188 n=1 Tax=Mytilus trossulus TaxID=6551 RepID=UPI003005DB3B